MARQEMVMLSALQVRGGRWRYFIQLLGADDRIAPTLAVMRA
jgi:hypothetical protein